jgi:uncharacterized protein (TIGR02246 family)
MNSRVSVPISMIASPPYMGRKTMKKLLMTSVVLLGFTGFANAAELSQAEAQKIWQPVGDQFVQAFKAKQGDKMAALYSNDGWRVTDTGPIIGKEALLKHFQDVVKVFDLGNNTGVDQVKVLGNNNILATGHWEGTLKLPDQPPIPQSGYWADTLTKQSDGNWKISMEAYNVKMAPPPAAK